MDKFRIDGHKLLYHVPRVNDWMEGKNTYPIYMEISPAGNCNHRCVYCGLDFMKYQNRRLKTEVLRERLAELGRLGLKSIMYAGEGEPFLHPDMPLITELTRAAGIDPAFTTNGVLLDEARAARVLPVTSWIKVSINAGTKATYAAVHGCKEGDFDTVLGNMRRAAALRRATKVPCTLGMQILLLPENSREVTTLAGIARDIGMDYLVVKPYSQHPQSETTKYAGISYEQHAPLADELAAYDTKDFQVIFRMQAMRRWDAAGKRYGCCLALPFWSYIDAGGGVWGCSVYLSDDRFYYGSIYENTFEEIWTGERRMNSLAWVREKLDISQCRVNCRMDAVNQYLWELKNPPAHVNFI